MYEIETDGQMQDDDEVQCNRRRCETGRADALEVGFAAGFYSGVRPNDNARWVRFPVYKLCRCLA